MAGTYRIEENGPHSFTLIFTGTCGHESKYAYGTREMAKKDGLRYIHMKCWSCCNAEQVERDRRSKK
jgi:hypothetical protein